MALKHSKLSTAPAPVNTAKVGGPDWNAPHIFDGGSMGGLLFRDTGSVDGANWLATGDLGQVLVAQGAGAVPAWTNAGFIVDPSSGSIAIGGAGSNIGGTNAPFRILTLYSATARNSFELAFGTDTDGATAGTLVWANALQSTSDKRIAQIRGKIEGSTALNRGGNITFETRPDNGSVIVGRGEINQAGAWGIGASSQADSQCTISSGAGFSYTLKLLGATNAYLRFSSTTNTIDMSGGGTIMGSGALLIVPNGQTFTFATNGTFTSAGDVKSNATAAIGFGSSRSLMRSPLDGQFTFTDVGGTHGIGFDILTDGTLKIRNRGQNADGIIQAGIVSTADGLAGTPSFAFSTDPTKGLYGTGTGASGALNVAINGTQRFAFDSGNFYIINNGATIQLGSASDVIVARDAANIFAQRNTTNAQIFRIYNTFTDATHNEFAGIGWNTAGSAANEFAILTDAGSAGGTQRNMRIGPRGAATLYFTANGAARYAINSSGFIDQSTLTPITIGGAAAIAVTSTDGLVIQNTTAAVVGITQQYSPRLVFSGTAWNSVGAASEIAKWAIENRPQNNAGATGAILTFLVSINGAGFGSKLSLDASGNLTSQGSLISNNNVTPPAAGLLNWNSRTAMASPADAQLNITNAAITSGIGFDVSTDGTLKIRNRAQNADGTLQAGIVSTGDGLVGTPAQVFASEPTSGWYRQASGVFRFSRQGTDQFQIGNGSIACNTLFLPSGGVASGSFNVALTGDAANALALRNGTNAQIFNIYESFTDSSNYSRGALYWSGGILRLDTQVAGTGVGNLRAIKIRTVEAAPITLATANADRWVIDGSIGALSYVMFNPIGTTSTDGLVVGNTNAATVGVPVQMSPRIKLSGSAWNSVGAASETDYFIIENLPATAAGATSAQFRIGASLAGAAVTYPLGLTSGGTLLLLNSGALQWGARGYMDAPADAQFNLHNNANSTGIGFDVATDSTVKIRTRAQSGYGSMDALRYLLSGGTIIGGALDGLPTITNSGATAGIGFDVLTDGTLKIRNRAQNAAAALSASTVAATTGDVTALSGNMTIASSGVFGWNTRSKLLSGADTHFELLDNAQAVGIGLDISTDGTLKIRNRAQNADGNLNGAIFTSTNNILVSSTQSTDQAYAFRVSVAHNTATGGTVYGATYSTTASHSSGTMNALQGFFSQAIYSGTSAASPAVNQMSGAFLRSVINGVSPTGTINRAYAFFVDPIANFATGTPAVTFTRAIGAGIENQGGTAGVNGLTVSNAIGIAINDQSGASNNCDLAIGTLTPASGNWAIYSTSTYASQFAGSLAASNFAGLGTVASSGDIRLQNSTSIQFSNSSAANRRLIGTTGTNSNDIVMGEAAANIKMQSNMAVPSALVNGDIWMESNTGAVTGSYGYLKARLNGSTVQVAPAIAGQAINTTQTSNQTILTLTPPSAAGRYRVSGVITTTSATNTGTVQITVDYVDSQGTVHTADIIALMDAAGVIATTKSGASKEYHTLPWLISINNAGTAIVVKVVITGAVSYTAAAAIEQIA